MFDLSDWENSFLFFVPLLKGMPDRTFQLGLYRGFLSLRKYTWQAQQALHCSGPWIWLYNFMDCREKDPSHYQFCSNKRASNSERSFQQTNATPSLPGFPISDVMLSTFHLRTANLEWFLPAVRCSSLKLPLSQFWDAGSDFSISRYSTACKPLYFQNKTVDRL